MQAILVCVLKSKRDEIEHQNVEWAPEEVKKREITITENKCCEFPYLKEPEDVCLEVIGLVKHQGKKKKRVDGDRVGDEEAYDDYDFKDDFSIDYDIKEVSEKDLMDDDVEYVDDFGVGLHEGR